jgi:hypothetical protein
MRGVALAPTELADVRSKVKATTLYAYPSSIGGMFSIVLGNGSHAGTRLTVEQVEELRQELSRFLDAQDRSN